MGITRQEIARILIEDMKWSDPKWSKRTGVTRQTFWRLRKQDYANIESKTLELMATAAGKKLEWNDMSKMEANIVSGLKDSYDISRKYIIDMRRAAMVLAIQRVMEAFEHKGIWP